MEYKRSNAFMKEEFKSKIMGPNPIKLAEELLADNLIKSCGRVMDLGSGQGLTSIFIAQEYGFCVYAADLWSEPSDNQRFFDEQGIARDVLVPVKADANDLPFEKEFFDGVTCIDAYNFFGRDKDYLDKKLLPFVKKGGYLYFAISGVKKDFNGDLPAEIKLSWTKEQMEYMRDIDYWTEIFRNSKDAEIVSIKEMKSNEEVWQDWIECDNEYAIGDSKAINAGACKYLNFISVVLRKK